MTFLVKLLRLLRLLAWLLYIGALSVPHYLRRDRWTAIREMCAMIKIWGRGLLDILNVKVEVHGDESPLNGALVVSNHLGVLDILVHSSLFGFRFAPKSDIRSWPFLGAYVGLTYPIWVDRGSKARSQELLAEFHDT
jgi:1-acyl-sn-glycerol-3-phosphate acyltransferase